MIIDVEYPIKMTPKTKKYIEEQLKGQQVTNDHLIAYREVNREYPSREVARSLLLTEIVNKEDYPLNIPNESSYLTVESFCNDAYHYSNNKKENAHRKPQKWEDKKEHSFTSRRVAWKEATPNSPAGLKFPKCHAVMEIERGSIVGIVKSVKVIKKEDGSCVVSIRTDDTFDDAAVSALI